MANGSEKSNLIESKHFNLSAKIDWNEFHWLNETQSIVADVTDNDTVHKTLVSVTDQDNHDYTFLFETLPDSKQYIGRFVHWSNHDGIRVGVSNLEMASKVPRRFRQVMLTAMTRVFVNQTQYMLAIINQKASLTRSN